MIAKERRELQQNPQEELDELVQLYVAKGLAPTTAQQVAEQLTVNDPVAAHLDAELNLVSEGTSPIRWRPRSSLPDPSP